MKNCIVFLVQEIRSLALDDQGLSVTEYAVAGGLVAAVAATAFTTLGSNIKTAIGSIATTVAG